MSSIVPPKPRLPTTGKSQITIVASQFNQHYTDALVDAAINELARLQPQARVDLIRVPGAFEIPLATKLILENESPSAVICLGLIIEGETAHADLVATAVTDQLLALSLQFNIPVIHEVLLVENEAQAEARCLGTQMNRGMDAAQAVVGMVEVCKELSRSARTR